jgi:hypothetical protein
MEPDVRCNMGIKRLFDELFEAVVVILYWYLEFYE